MRSLIFNPIYILADIYEREESSILPLGIETECVGGGRIQHDDGDKIISVFGYSMVSPFYVFKELRTQTYLL